jgi:16S rRNA (cytosine1402-N4)-methyltransferase
MINPMSDFSHLPVLSQEVLEYLDPQPGKTYIDATLGGGGHSGLILERLAGSGHLYSFDQDAQVIERISERAQGVPNWTLVHANFEEIKDYCKTQSISLTGGVLMDLGLSSIQLDDPERGFNFESSAPLDMRLNPQADLTAELVVNFYPASKLADIFYEYGEERKSRQLAQYIVNKRPFHSCRELADAVKIFFAKQSSGKSFRIHPATRAFQALRIYVNRELEVLESTLNDLPDLLAPGARIVVISFHSLEDRIVKNAFKNPLLKDCLKILTKKPIMAGEQETLDNPRSRSAKLRAVERL